VGAGWPTPADAARRARRQIALFATAHVDAPDLVTRVLSLETWSRVTSLTVGCLSGGALVLDPAVLTSVLASG